jgi:hypothetical protein
MDFEGERWSTHDTHSASNDKMATADKYGLNLVKGATASDFSTDQSVIHYGYHGNSGFQSLGLALLLGSPYIVLVGFDMQFVSGKSHFFGDHPRGLHQREEYESFARYFPVVDGVTIVNATPGSAIKTYPIMEFEDAVEDYSLHCDGSERYAKAG